MQPRSAYPSSPSLSRRLTRSIGQAFFNRDDGFRQVHTHEDVRIVLGWFSCLVAGGVSLYGWKAGWAATKGWTYFAVSTSGPPLLTSRFRAEESVVAIRQLRRRVGGALGVRKVHRKGHRLRRHAPGRVQTRPSPLPLFLAPSLTDDPAAVDDRWSRSG